MSSQYHYPGEELAIFENARNWKNYFASMILPFIKGKVLEVGAGIGGTTRILHDGSVTNWTLLEPDEQMYRQLVFHQHIYPKNTTVVNGTLNDLKGSFDTILYIDVLEHIEQDKEELEKATTLLSKGGHLIVLSPAHPFLYSAFDKAIGHFRRYRKKELAAIAPPVLKLVHAKYLDMMGYWASMMNRLLLRQSYPTKKQVELWDHHFVPISRVIDRLFFYSFGKSILAVWEKS